jgi:hypothetical protein
MATCSVTARDQTTIHPDGMVHDGESSHCDRRSYKVADTGDGVIIIAGIITTTSEVMLVISKIAK